MFYYKKRNNKEWQKTYIREVFKHKDKRNENYSRIILDNIDLLKRKDEHLPNTLYKFYAPTSNNIIDIKKQRLWLSHPNNFNDPFDCHTGYDSLEYEKKYLLNFIKSSGCVDEINSRDGFTIAELERISKSSTSLEYYTYYNKIEDYDDVKRKIIEKKSEDFQQKVSKLLRNSMDELELKIKKLRNINIRVACFSEFDRYDGFNKKIQMWSHYADNHKGFCVEYDVSYLKKETTLSLEDYKYFSDKDSYLNERIKALIKGGMFPVIYTSNRVNIPFSRLKKIKIDDLGELNQHNDINELIYKTFIVKSTNWSYEKEWRIILDGNICNYYDNKIPFPYIKRIYLGCKMEKKTIETMFEIGEDLSVEVVILRMDDKKFLLEESSANIYKWNKEILRWNNPFEK